MLNENVGILERDGECTSMPACTLPCLLLKAVETYRKPDAFKFKQDGNWRNLSHEEFLRYVEELFFALRALGVMPQDRVAIMSENRVEWAIADYAALCLGTSTVPIYPTLSPQQIDVLLRDARPTVVFPAPMNPIRKIGE